MMEEITAASPEEADAFQTNDLSILIVLSGKYLRWFNEEKPVPKSSIDSFTPRALRPFNAARILGSSAITEFSVSSNSKQPGSIELCSRMLKIVREGSTSLNCLAETLTAR